MNRLSFPPSIRAVSGLGHEIYDKLLKNQFEKAYQYDRVASFYDPKSLVFLLRDFARMWKRGGKVRLIIGYHERFDLAPALSTDLRIRSAIRNSVAKAMVGYIDELRKLLDEDDTLIPTIKEMINQRGLHVRLVTPRTKYDRYLRDGIWHESDPTIFHSKFMIFHHHEESTPKYTIMKHMRKILRRLNREYYDSRKEKSARGENFSVVTTSMNESLQGYTNNIEDAVLHRSWVENERDVASYFLTRFNNLWADNCPDVISMPFTDKVAEILEIVDEEKPDDHFSWSNFVELLFKSPIYHGISFPRVSLLSHQLSVYKFALSRWPVRVLLADEVGLGKTIEAGSIVSYLITQCDTKRVMILTPASLMLQWQREMKELFNMEFWIYDSRKKTCISDHKETEVGNTPLNSQARIEKVIVSWHWARMRSVDQIFASGETPDLVIVDEAHHARIHDDGVREYSTKLHQLLMEMKDIVPHILLLTATPFQTCILDYYSLLQILGIPDEFRAKLGEYAEWALGKRLDRLSTWVPLIRDIHNYMLEYNLTSDESIIKELIDKPLLHSSQYEDLIKDMGGLPHEYVIEFHPATFLAARNYRSSLKAIGYHFPKTILESPSIKITTKQASLLADIEEYIHKYLGLPEMGSRSVASLGLMKSIYRQRIVSSISAAYSTLNGRREKLEAIKNSGVFSDLNPEWADDFSLSDYDENEDMDSTQIKIDADLSPVRENALTEFYTLNRLLDDISHYIDGDTIIDPKMIRLKEVVNRHISAGRKVLVFSRFTDTTEAVVKTLAEFANTAGLGRFDGSFIGFYEKQDNRLLARSSTRTDIVRGLKSGIINILICSDAASEGLNLHSANVVINIDVPWNPARLLQRFGRVDRLGQKAEEVHLVNLYYPDSIEQRMYEVLEDRRTDFRAVLGEVPEIMSETQKQFISALGTDYDFTPNVTLEEIQKRRRQYQKGKIVGKSVFHKGTLQAKLIYQSLIRTLAKMADESKLEYTLESETKITINGIEVSLDSLDDNFQGFQNKSILEFEIKKHRSSYNASIHMILSNQRYICFAIIPDEDKSIIPLLSKDWIEYFNFCFRGKPVNTQNLERFRSSEHDNLLTHIRTNESWLWPDHRKMRCLSQVIPDCCDYANIEIGKEIGRILIK